MKDPLVNCDPGDEDDVAKIATGQDFTAYNLTESITHYHNTYGCLVCGDTSGECTPTRCKDDN